MVHQGFICSTFYPCYMLLGFLFSFLTCWMFVLCLRGIKQPAERILLLLAGNFQAKFLNFLQHHKYLCMFVCLFLWAFLCYNHLFIGNKDLLQHWLHFFKQIIELPVNSEMGNNILVIYSMALFIACFVLFK